jgi:tripartite-type tricarboxylate transporter receptor subunit TctC
MMIRMRLLASALFIAAAAFGDITAARAEFPEKPITLVVPYGPGGGTDLSARILAPAMEKILGQPVVVENSAGGGGAVALGQLFAAEPDGYTIAVGTGSNMTIIPHTTEVGYEVADFTYVANYFGWPYLIVLHPSVPADDLDELVAWAKENPNGLISGTTGGFNIHMVAMGLLSDRAGGLEIRSLPSNSAAESTARILAGDTNVVVGSPATYMEHIKAGDLKALAIVSDVVGPELEGLDIEKSADALGFELTNTTVVIGPPGMPEDVRSTLQSAIEQALQDPEVVKQVNALGFPVQFDPGPEAKEKTMATYDTYGRIIEDLLAED